MAFTGHHLLVAADSWPPYVMFPEGKKPVPGEEPSGAAVDTFRLIARSLNFTYTFVRSIDGFWGTRLANGSFNGMMGMVLRGEVQFALGPFIQTQERQQAIAFTEVFVSDSISIFLPRPHLTKDLSGFLKPFSKEVWGFLVLSVIISMLGGMLLQTFSRRWFYDESAPSTKKKQTSSRTLHAGTGRHPAALPRVTTTEREARAVFRPDRILWALTSDTKPSMHDRHAGRILMGTWLMTGLVLSIAYSSALTSILAVPHVNIPVDSLNDLVRSRMRYATEDHTAIYQMFKAAETGVMREIGQNMEVVKACYYARFDIKDNNLAVICDIISMKMVISDEFSKNATCSYYIARQRMAGGSLAFVFPKGSPYKERFDLKMRTLGNAGITNRLVGSYTANATACLVPPGSEQGGSKTQPITVKDLGGVFLLLLGGACFSLVILLIEVTACILCGPKESR